MLAPPLRAGQTKKSQEKYSRFSPGPSAAIGALLLSQGGLKLDLCSVIMGGHEADIVDGGSGWITASRRRRAPAYSA
ncbi:MAG: hypothetical protein V3S67_01625 [Gammaproteobacteria bacterium]